MLFCPFLCRANTWALWKAGLSSQHQQVVAHRNWAGRKVLALAPCVSNTCFQKPEAGQDEFHPSVQNIILVSRSWTFLLLYNLSSFLAALCTPRGTASVVVLMLFFKPRFQNMPTELISPFSKSHSENNGILQPVKDVIHCLTPLATFTEL